MDLQFATMMRLRDSEQLLSDPDHDIRGRRVVDCDGHEIGKIDELLIDTESNKVRLLRVEHGGLFGIGAMPLYIPAEAVVHVSKDVVTVNRSRAQVAEAPAYDPDLFDGDKYFARLHRHYGRT